MKNWTQVPAGEINGAQQRFWVTLGDHADAVAERINIDQEYLTRLAGFAVDNLWLSDKSSTSLNPQWLKAREIMGANFFGIEEAIKYFGVNPSKQQIATLAEVPFSEEVLRSCKDTHILVAVFPLSILDIRGIAKSKCPFYNQDWYNKESFAKDKGEVGWQLVRKEPVADSTSKNWTEQQALLSKDEETPKAQVMVYTIIGHFLATGERLFEKVYVRCVDLDSDGNRVILGGFGAGGLLVDDDWDGSRRDNLGVSASRKQ